MKKVLSILISAMLLFSLCIPAFAADAITAEVKTTLDNGVLTLTLAVPADTDLATFESALQYDAEKLELTDVVYGAGDMTTVNKDTAGTVRLFMVWAASQTDAATLATVTFKVKDGATGKAAFSFKDTSATNSADAALEFSFGGSGTSFEVALTDAPPTDEKIPATAGKYIAVGTIATVVAAAAVAAGAVAKRKKQEA